MNKHPTITLSSILNVLLVYCLLRFGLVMTTGFSLFSLPLVVAVGAAIVALCLILAKSFANRLLRLNALFLMLNIVCIFIASIATTRAEFIAVATNYMNQLLVLFLLWAFYLYLGELDVRSRNRLVLIYLLLLLVSTAYTLYVEMNGHERIIRNTAFGEYDDTFRFLYGGFDFIYGLVLVYSILLTVLLHGKEKIKTAVKVFIIASLALLAFTVIGSGYTTAFAIILIFTLLSLIRSIPGRIILFVVLILGFFIFPRQLADFILSLTFIPELTTTRIADLILSFTGQATAEYLSMEGQRLDRMRWSIEAFFAHPLFGVIGNSATNKLGYHTEWIDQLARYGIIPFLLHSMFWVQTGRNMLQDNCKKSITVLCLKNTLFLYFLLGFLNPISMVITTAPLFLLCPFVEELFITSD